MEQKQSRRTAKHWFWLIGVPLLMLLIGLWQWSRVPPADAVNAQLAEYRELIEELDALQARDGWKATVKDGSGNTIGASLAKSRVESAMRDLEDSRGLGNITRALQGPLAAATVVLSALALLWAGLGMSYQRRMGARAMRSREQLLAAFVRGKELLPTYMVVMVALFFGAAIALMVYELMPVLRHQHYNRGDMKLIALAVLVAATLPYYGVRVLIDVIRAARKPFASEPVRVMGQAVTREQAPGLWAFVEDVARRVGANPPDAIVAGLDEGFFVTEHEVQLRSGAKAPSGRVLYLPLPYMAFMNASEVAAVVGHELGHFIGEDTVYSQRFAPIYAAGIRQIEAVGGNDSPKAGGWRSLVTRPATIFGEMFLDSFHEAVRYWSRQRELAADAVGARVAGAKAVATALLRITALEPRVHEALAAQWDTGKTVAGGVLGHVRQLVAAKGMTDPGEHLQNRQSHPFDTHPELAVRLQAVGVPVSDELLQCARDPAPSQLLQEFGLEAAAPAQAGEADAETVAAAPAPVADIQAALQTELTGVAASDRKAKIDALSAMVKAAQAEQPVFERVWPRMAFAGFLAFLALFLGAIFALLSHTGNGRLLGLGMLAVGILPLAWCVSVFRRGRQPALIVRADGLRWFSQSAVLPWSAITDFGLTQINDTLKVRLDLDRQTRPPALGVSRLRGSYSEARSQVILSLLLGDKRAKKAAEILISYWRAYRAQVELQRMGEMAAPINKPIAAQTFRNDFPSQGGAMPVGETVFESHKKQILRGFIGACGFVLVGVVFIALGMSSIFKFGNPVFVYGFWFIDVAFFGWVAMIAGGKLLNKKSGLVFNNLGIIDKSNAMTLGMIPWSEIAGAEKLDVLGQKMLKIMLRDPRQYIARAGMLKKIALKINHWTGGTPVIIAIAPLKTNLPELEKVFSDYWQKYGKA